MTQELGPKTNLLTINDNNERIADFEEGYNTAPGFFGVNLDHEAPIPVCDAISYLRVHGKDQQGIFRTPGNLARVKEIMDVYNKKYKKSAKKTDPHFSVLNEVEDIKPNDVASLLKKFFNELTEPLIPQKFKSLMMFLVKSECSDEEKAKELHEILNNVPSPNKEVAGYVLQFLRDMLEFQETTKMDAKNLGMCLAVCFFRGLNSTEQIMLSTFGTLIIEAFISSSLPLPQPKAILVTKNTLYDEMFTPNQDVLGGTRGSSIFTSLRNSSLVKTLIGPQKTQNKVLRSMLEDIPVPTTNKHRNSKDNDGANFRDIKDSTSQGSNEGKKINDEEVMAQDTSANLIPKRKNSFNSYASSNNKTMKNLKVEIMGVKQSDTFLELKEKNKASPALPPENTVVIKKKGRKGKAKKGSVGSTSSIGETSMLLSPVLPVSGNQPPLASPGEVKALDSLVTVKTGEDDDEHLLHVSPGFDSNMTSARESFMGVRFNVEDIEKLKAERKKKRKHRKGQHRDHNSRTNSDVETPLNDGRALPPIPPKKPVLNVEETADRTSLEEVLADEV